MYKRQVLKVLLTSHDYEVITAESGEEGIAKAKSELPDLILMDVVMPGLNAVSYTHLRAHETVLDLVCRLLLEKKTTQEQQATFSDANM